MGHFLITKFKTDWSLRWTRKPWTDGPIKYAPSTGEAEEAKYKYKNINDIHNISEKQQWFDGWMVCWSPAITS